MTFSRLTSDLPLRTKISSPQGGIPDLTPITSEMALSFAFSIKGVFSPFPAASLLTVLHNSAQAPLPPRTLSRCSFHCWAQCPSSGDPFRVSDTVLHNSCYTPPPACDHTFHLPGDFSTWDSARHRVGAQEMTGPKKELQ